MDFSFKCPTSLCNQPIFTKVKSFFKKFSSTQKAIAFVTVVCTVAGVFIAISSSNSEMRQAALLAAERKQAQTECHPQFTYYVDRHDVPFIQYNIEQNQKGREVDIYTIKNYGGKIYDVSIEQKEYLVITRHISSENKDSVAFIPIYNRTQNSSHLYFDIASQDVQYEEFAPAFSLSGKGLRDIRFKNESSESEDYDRGSICIVYTVEYTDLTGERVFETYIPIHNELRIVDDLPGVSSDYIDLHDANLGVGLYYSLVSCFEFLHSKFNDLIDSETLTWTTYDAAHSISWYYEDNNLKLYKGPAQWISESITWLVDIDENMLFYMLSSSDGPQPE